MNKLLPRSTSRFMAVLACIMLMSLLFTAITNAQDTYSDPVMDAVHKAGLVTQLGYKQSIDGVSITLDWAYADTQHIKLSYTLETPSSLNPMNYFTYHNSPRLKDDKGASFSYASSSFTPTDNPNQISYTVDYYTQAILSVKGTRDVTINDYFNPPPEKINLSFDAHLGGFIVEEGMVPPNTSLKVGDTITALGPFVFDFTIPLFPAIVIKQEQTFQLKNVSLTLDKLTITPTTTTAHICFTPPDARDWMLEGTVNIGDNVGYPNGGSRDGGKGAALSEAIRCGQYNFSVFHDRKAATLNLNFDHLAVSMSEGPDDWNKIKAELAKRNIKIDVISVSHGLDIKVLSVPDGVDYNQAVIEAREALGDWIQGPWTFKVDLPAS